MFKANGKIYWPSRKLVIISIIMLIIAYLCTEGAKTLTDLITPFLLILVFGPVVFVDACHERE
ncbi:MAG: hypothetical protein WHF31_15385 [Candidatus Dehalobacter alkaniphilus]